MALPEDYRRGIYSDGKITATVDVRISKFEILMHDETNDRPFVLTPQKLKKWARTGTR